MNLPALNFFRGSSAPAFAADAAGSAAEQPKTKVFVSYSRKDLPFIDRLTAGLEAHGIAPLIDRTEIYAFEDWWKRLEKLINEADTVIFVLSPDAVSSDVCKKEVDYALSLRKRFAPIVSRRIDGHMDAIPAALAELNFIFFDDPEKFDSSLARLVEALATDIAWVRQSTQFGLAALAWSATKSSGLLLRSPRLEEAESWIAARPQGAPMPAELTQSFIGVSRREATRRRNLLTGGLGAGLVLAIVLAGLAFWQRNIAVQQEAIAKQATQRAETERDAAQAAQKEATAQRNRAEAVLGASTGTARSLVVDLAEKFREVKGVQLSVVEDILNKANGLLAQLQSFSNNTPSVLLNRAETLSELGLTFGQQGAGSDGIQMATKAYTLAQQLARTQPNLAGVNYAHGRAAEVLGQLSERTNPQIALPLFNEAIAAYAKSFAAHLANRDSLFHEAWTAGRIGNVYFAAHQYDQALPPYRQSLDLAQKYKALAPGRQSALLLAQRYDHLGRTEYALNDLGDAQQEFAAAISLIAPLADGSSPPADLLFELSSAYNNFGAVLRSEAVAQHNAIYLNQSVGYIEQAAKIMIGLTNADPGNSFYWSNLAIDYYNLAGETAALGQRQAAANFRNRSLLAEERAKQVSASASPGAAAH